ncbi:oxidoreductase C-terminal domain-containing protein [Actinospica acidiphila]|uniref:oxidoreductase C-terminal domain-containing protein n=1 Tax=Actinospica acidiphila TaxID=304899 RepID=UPI0035561A89
MAPTRPGTPGAVFWTDQYAAKLQIAGLTTGHDRCETDGIRPPAASRCAATKAAGCSASSRSTRPTTSRHAGSLRRWVPAAAAAAAV